MSILNPLFELVAKVMMGIHWLVSLAFGASSGWTWALSIILLVVLMRLIMLPLFIKQVKSQRKMQAHMPQLRELQKKYKNDKQRLNEETMKFYKENGINPLGGCLPLVAQLPLFWALFNVLKAIADWKPGTTPAYGMTKSLVESAQNAHVFGVALYDNFLRPVAGETWAQRVVILLFVLVSALTTFLTMRQSAKRGMLNQQAPDPDQPGAAMAASMSKNMMYIAPFFALTGLYWQFGLVLYWVTTNIWTLGQQHFLFRNLPVVESATVGASATQAASGNANGTVRNGTARSGAAKSGPAKGAPVRSASAKSAADGRNDSAARATGKESVPGKTGATAKSPSAKPGTAKPAANVNGTPVTDAAAAPANGAGKGLLRFGKGKPEPEPEAVPTAPQAKVVRQQPVRQSRSKRKR